MSDVTVKIGGDATGVANAVKRARESVKTLGEGISPFLGVSVGAMGIGALAEGLVSALEKMRSIEAGSKRLKMSAEDFQTLGEAAEDAGLSIEEVGGAFAKMRREAATGGKVFDFLGLNAQEISSGNQIEQFGKVAKAIMALKDAQMQDAAANEIFGKSFADILPFLENYNALIEDARKKSKLTNEEVRRGAEDARNVKDIGGAAQTGAIKLLSQAINAGKSLSLYDAGTGKTTSGMAPSELFGDKASGMGESVNNILLRMLLQLDFISKKIPGDDTGGR